MMADDCRFLPFIIGQKYTMIITIYMICGYSRLFCALFVIMICVYVGCIYAPIIIIESQDI